MPARSKGRNDIPHSIAGNAVQRLLERTLGTGAALLLLVLVLITCVDVVGRYVLNAPLTGAFEMTELLLVALVFTALPLATERREHVEVDLLASAFGGFANRLMMAFAGLFSAAVLTTFSWRLAHHALKSAENDAVTNALQIPLAPFGFLAAAACLISAFIALLRAIQLPSEPILAAEKDEGAQ